MGSSDITLIPGTNGQVTTSQMTVGNLQFSGSTIQATDSADGNIILTPASNGAIKAGSISISGGTMSANGDLTLTASSGDLNISTGTSQDVALLPSGDGVVVIGKAASAADSTVKLDVEGSVKATSYSVQNDVVDSQNSYTFDLDTSADISTISYAAITGLERKITLTTEATVVIHYQVSHQMMFQENALDDQTRTLGVLGTLSTILTMQTDGGSEIEQKAARATQGVRRAYSASDDLAAHGSSAVTNSGFLVTTLSAGEHVFRVKYKKHVEGCGDVYPYLTYNGDSRSSENGNAAAYCRTTFSEAGAQADGEGRSLQIMILGSGHTIGTV